MKNPFKIIEERQIFRSKIFEVREEILELEDGSRTDRTLVFHPGSIAVLPIIDDSHVFILRQYRHALREWIYEFPAGTLEPKEVPENCVARELEEEIGYTAGEIIDLGAVYPAPGFCNETQYCYAARQLSPSAVNHDEDEIIEVDKISLDELYEIINSGKLMDAKSLALVLKARLKGLIA